MLQQLYIFILKIAFGTTIGLIGAYSTKRKKKMRIFDNFTADVKIDILESAVAYAKAEYLENPYAVTDVQFAVGYGEMFLLEEADFGLIDPSTVVAWVGSRPPHRPKTW